MSVVNDITPAIEEAYPLYLQVYQRSHLHFEKLTPGYFSGLGTRLGDKNRFFIWRGPLERRFQMKLDGVDRNLFSLGVIPQYGKMMRPFAFALVALLLIPPVASAQQFGTKEEARAMLDRAVVALKTDEHKALSEISDPNNKQFHDLDLYVSCFNTSDGNFTAFPSPGMIGIDVRSFKLAQEAAFERIITRRCPPCLFNIIPAKFSVSSAPRPRLPSWTARSHESLGHGYQNWQLRKIDPQRA